ncbi:hypothetical protein BZZ01_17370 [Nostocales cyanobacterium HT-58-2]|nr:hypothetical protein BZZ01_17370 [Nostocales cyanobacterium HT-58-2]
MSLANSYSVYDPFARIYNEYYANREETMQLLEMLQLPHLTQEAHILDLGCGTGQVAQLLLKKGYKVTGLDESDGMLHYARKNAPGANFILGDIRYFELPSTFDGVISTGSSLNHILSLEELKGVFHNVYTAMLENGLFLFDLYLEEYFQSENDSMIAGDVKDEYVWGARASYHVEEKISQTKVTIFELLKENWQRLDITMLMKSYSREEVQSALENVGFTEVSIYNAERLFEKSGTAGEVYFVCRKPLS